MLRAGCAERALGVLRMAVRQQLGADWIEPLVDTLHALLAHTVGALAGDAAVHGDAAQIALAATRVVAGSDGIAALAAVMCTPAAASEVGVAETCAAALLACATAHTHTVQSALATATTAAATGSPSAAAVAPASQLHRRGSAGGAITSNAASEALDDIGRALVMYADAAPLACAHLLAMCALVAGTDAGGVSGSAGSEASAVTARAALLSSDTLQQTLRSLVAAPPDASIGAAASALRNALGLRV